MFFINIQVELHLCVVEANGGSLGLKILHFVVFNFILLT
jgi:hypothetical protein